MLRSAPINLTVAARVTQRKANFFSNRHPFNKTQNLMDEGHFLFYVGLLRLVKIALAFEQNSSLVRGVNAREGFYEC